MWLGTTPLLPGCIPWLLFISCAFPKFIRHGGRCYILQVQRNLCGTNHPTLNYGEEAGEQKHEEEERCMTACTPPLSLCLRELEVLFLNLVLFTEIIAHYMCTVVYLSLVLFTVIMHIKCALSYEWTSSEVN